MSIPPFLDSSLFCFLIQLAINCNLLHMLSFRIHVLISFQGLTLSYSFWSYFSWLKTIKQKEKRLILAQLLPRVASSLNFSVIVRTSHWMNCNLGSCCEYDFSLNFYTDIQVHNNLPGNFLLPLLQSVHL